ncbi:MAG: hypothetical protein V7607_1727 [Solirubrobacteraceae bacterium]
MADDGRDPWLGVELRHLAALSAIASEGTFSEAALSLGYVQSAVSGQLATLERLTGIRLIERSRGHGPKRLTEAGELLVAHAASILDELDGARHSLSDDEHGAPSALRIALSSELSDRASARLLSAGVAKPPAAAYAQVDTVAADHLAETLVGRAADVGLTPLPLNHAEIATAMVIRQPLVLAVPKGSPLERRPPTTSAKLSRVPLVVWTEGCEPSRVELELADQGVFPHVIARADTPEVAAMFVRDGLGVCLLPHGSVAEDPGVALLEFDDRMPARLTGLAWLRVRSRDARLRGFIDLVCRLRDEP